MNKKKNSLGFNNKDLFSCSLVWRMTALADQVSLGSAGQFCCWYSWVWLVTAGWAQVCSNMLILWSRLRGH